jgi:iron complex transport system substrate-binding protein
VSRAQDSSKEARYVSYLADRIAFIPVAGALVVLSLILIARPAPADGEHARKTPERIVSLAPSVTEMLFALGLGDRIVGATDHCDFPPEAKKIPRVGGLGRPNVEKLLSLAPDLVIATDLERKELAEALRRVGIEVLELKIGNFAELFDAERKLGDAVGKPEQAARQVLEMQARLEAAAKLYAGVPRDRLPKVFIEVWADPLITAGGASFLDDVVARAGGVNVAHELKQEYPTINPERVVAWDPDAILLCDATEGNEAAEVAGRIGWGGIKAVREGRIIADISPDLLVRPGPRLVTGVEQLAERLHPASLKLRRTGAASLKLPQTSPPRAGEAVPLAAEISPER